ncbi:hypothetical protein [Bdellovibrio reynosensis]|uniref:Uncharacterized protein n=1 Tax=Bdellovibrio reynosensis TaxID=2835041 RepID=A0ABY4C4R2_9BACT|nr:hypothetical protein [Bdellovibrio reynosensis]UOE99947.1 hypothetical protein MNR06_09575 [Bdellovibrio reynosensis]
MNNKAFQEYLDFMRLRDWPHSSKEAAAEKRSIFYDFGDWHPKVRTGACIVTTSDWERWRKQTQDYLRSSLWEFGLRDPEQVTKKCLQLIRSWNFEEPFYNLNQKFDFNKLIIEQIEFRSDIEGNKLKHQLPGMCFAEESSLILTDYRMALVENRILVRNDNFLLSHLHHEWYPGHVLQIGILETDIDSLNPCWIEGLATYYELKNVAPDQRPRALTRVRELLIETIFVLKLIQGLIKPSDLVKFYLGFNKNTEWVYNKINNIYINPVFSIRYGAGLALAHEWITSHPTQNPEEVLNRIQEEL